MNTANNSRRRHSRELIERAFVEMLQHSALERVSVSDICKATGLNRSTFYANYCDVYDLADKIREKLEAEVSEIYSADIANRYQSTDYLRLLEHIRDNQLFYRTYFKLGYDREHEVNLAELNEDNMIFPDDQMQYHIEFFRAGFNAMVKRWMDGGCKESPEQMVQILRDEYRVRM